MPINRNRKNHIFAMTREEMKNKLQTVLRPRRFAHSVNVMETAVKLAEKYNLNLEQSAIAGLLHDCARDIKGDQVFRFCDKFDIRIDYITKSQPELLHGPIGSKLAMEEYGVKDMDILNAISCHTTGRENMNLLDKVIFIADYIEPGRNFPGVNEARKLAFEDIDGAMVFALERTIRFVMDKGALIHPNTISARNYIVFERFSHNNKSLTD